MLKRVKIWWCWIGVMLIDSFCNRGAKDTWRDQSKATMVSQAIDTMMAYQFMKSHPRSNGKIGTNGHSRGGTNSLLVADVKFTSKFLEDQMDLMQYLQRLQSAEWQDCLKM